MIAFDEYNPPNGSGDEQNFISQHFGLQEGIGSLDIALNFQVHQLPLTAAHDNEEDRWISLANRPDQIACYHFSTLPKPSALLLGEITESNCGWMWGKFWKHAEWYNDEKNT